MNLINEQRSFSFTFTIPFNKRVYYCGKKRVYGAMLQDQQYKMLVDLLEKVIAQEKFEFIDYVFEAHADARLHIHGYAIVSSHVLETENPVDALRESFYNHNQIIKLSRKSYSTLSNIQKTLVDINYWFEYIEKNQEEICYLSPYRQSLKDIGNMDYLAEYRNETIRSIDVRPTSPPPGYYDSYRFTGGKDKYFYIEL